MSAPKIRPTPRPRSVVRRLIVASVVLCLFWPLGIALAALSGISHRWVDILAQFTAPATIMAVVLTVIALVAGSRIGAVFGLAGVGLCLVAAWPQWSPPRQTLTEAAASKPTPPAVPEGQVATLYFANLYMSNTDVAAIGRSIREADADIVVLVEMSDVAASRMDALLADFPYRAIERHKKGRLGDRIVVASRWPLIPIDPRDHMVSHTAATVRTPMGPVDVVGVHLTRPWPYQYQWSQIIQAMALTEVVADLDNPVLIAGDFNSVSSAAIGRQLRQKADLVPAPGWPGTWPAQVPSPLAITIDQVYRGPGLTFVDRKLGRRSGSDHRPVIVRFSRSAG